MMSLLKRFSARDLIIIASIAAVGIAVKPIVNPITKLISTPLGIPGGSLSGGLYMMWLVLVVTIINKRWTGTVYGVLQAVLVLLIGMAGRQGAFSLISYSLPGLAADLLYLAFKNRDKLFTHISLCALTNVTGALCTAIIFFRLPLPMVCFNFALALASGIIGGYLSYGVYQALKQARIII